MVGRLFQNLNVTFSFRSQYIHSRCIYSIHSRPAIVNQDFNAFKSTIIIKDMHECMHIQSLKHNIKEMSFAKCSNSEVGNEPLT